LGVFEEMGMGSIEENGTKTVRGGMTNYGQVAGILMMDSTIPRIPGDPGHAETFPFPVRYGVVRDFPFDDLVECRKDRVDLVIQAARDLEQEGVHFVAADCGLFSIYQEEVADALDIPFLGSSLSLIPLLSAFLPKSRKIGLLTGDTRLLKDEHLAAASAEREGLVIRGMERCQEFQRVVVERGDRLHVERMRQGVLEAAEDLSGPTLGAVVLECTNLVTFRADVQRLLRVPVFDMVSLIEFFADGYRLRTFHTHYVRSERSG
jgi:aspartate/glutamate racemase